MSTMNISLPDALKAFVDERVESGDYGTSSEYVRELIRADMQRRHLYAELRQGLVGDPAPATASYFDALRQKPTWPSPPNLSS